MTVNVRIPSVLRNLTAGQETIAVAAQTVDEAINALEARHPGIKARLCDDAGKLRRFVNVFVAEEDIRFLDGQRTAVKDGDLIDIVPAIAGGCGRAPAIGGAARAAG
ncbi:MAG TPA: MoaD/ThiS family protein [Planctomycetota bacterium]|nr:MoaD/ThiS family protein [Planctomycetota bacterium]